MRFSNEEMKHQMKRREWWSRFRKITALIVILLIIVFGFYVTIQDLRNPDFTPSVETQQTSVTEDEAVVDSVATEEPIEEQRPDSAPLSTRHQEKERQQPVSSVGTENFELPLSITNNNEFWVCSGTVYNLTVGQCDGDPSTPACPGYHLTEDDAASLEYIAVSRNLLSRNTRGAPFNCGEVVYVTGMNPEWLDGYKTIVDVSGRYRNHVDFLTPMGINTGRSSSVRIYKLE